MRKSIGTLLVTLIAFGLIDLAPAKDVMNDHLLSLVRSYNQLENKLERHEYRERALGEIIKKGLQSLQMGQRSMEPMKGIFSRLDERVSQIETLLMSQEQKYSLQTEKIEEIIKLIKWTNENNNRNAIMPSIPVVVEAPENLEMLKEVRSLSANVAKLIDMSAKLIEKTEKMSKKAPETEDLLNKMQSTLVKLYTPPVTTTAAPIIFDNSEFENKVMTSFESIAANIKDLKTTAPPPPVQCASGLIEADKEFIQALTNETLTALQSLKVDALGASEKALSTITSQIDDSKGAMDDKLSQLRTDLNETIALLGRFQADVNSSYSSLNDGLASFNKIVMSNSDEIVNTQRKIEFATHQISQKVSDLIVFQNLELSQALMKRFDDVEESIGNNHIEALQNITSTMESEISNVWRQIEIMHSEITESKNELNKLNGETETYVNGTFSTMDGMEAKVSKITSRMLDVDSNLNYLLGRLSLITQEFNQIKVGLGDALEQIRGSFKEVRDKVNKGSGPHEIPKNQYDLEHNLLSK